MNKERFWAIVGASRLKPPTRLREVDAGERNRCYRAALAELTPRELVDFQRTLEGRLIRAYRWDMWAAAILIRDGCTPDSFRCFRAWLVSQGRDAFAAALRDPDSLADNAEVRLDASCHYPAFWSIPLTAYRERTGRDMPDRGIAEPEQPTGKRLGEDPRDLAKHLPRLYQACFRDHWEEDPAEPECNVPPPPEVAVPPMAEERFWAIIGESRQQAGRKKLRPGEDFIDRHIEELAKTLRQLAPGELIAYDRRFDYYHALAYRWDLWAAAYWLHAGCSDDGFIDFRSCLISLGKKLFFQVLGDPDSLAEIVGRSDTPYLQAEGFQYVASKVYEERTGERMPGGKGDGPTKPKGKRIDHEDDEVMRRHFPRIVARFPDMGD